MEQIYDSKEGNIYLKARVTQVICHLYMRDKRLSCNAALQLRHFDLDYFIMQMMMFNVSCSSAMWC